MSAHFQREEERSAGDGSDTAGLCGLSGDRDSSRRRPRPSSRSRRRWRTSSRPSARRPLLAQKTQELSDRAHAEHDLKKAAKELGATVKTSDLVDPTAQVPDIGALTGAAAQLFT